MGYFNRFLLFIYALAIAAAALGLIVLCFHILTIDEIINEVKFVLSRWETIAASAVVFLWSVHLLCCALSSGSKEGNARGEMIILSGATGKVSVAVEAVKKLIEKAACSINEVRDVKAAVRTAVNKDGNSDLIIRLKLAVGHDSRVTNTADAVRGAVTETLEKVLGLTGCQVEVEISDLFNGNPSNGSRVE